MEKKATYKTITKTEKAVYINGELKGTVEVQYFTPKRLYTFYDNSGDEMASASSMKKLIEKIA